MRVVWPIAILLFVGLLIGICVAAWHETEDYQRWCVRIGGRYTEISGRMACLTPDGRILDAQ